MIKNSESKKNRIKTIMITISIFIVLLLNYYYVISPEFLYLGYTTEFFTINKMIMTFAFISIIIFLSAFVKRGFYRLIYSIVLVFYFFGQAIYYIFNETSFILVFLASLPLIAILLADIIDNGKVFKRKTINLKDKRTRLFIISIALLALLPFFKYIGTVNLKNLLLIDVYETRALLRATNIGILGYIFSPLSRTIFPFLFVYGFKEKRKNLVLFSLIGIILLFLLNGAVKSVFFGIFAAILFLKGNYLFKEKFFLKMFQFINILGLLSYWILNIKIIDDYLRRIVMVPARLYNIYYNFFYDNSTFFSHSKLYSFITNTDNEMPITRYIGEVVLGKEGLNANVGIFVEGFVSFGIIGVAVTSLIFMILLIYVRKLNFSHEYFGIFFAYIYIINTSFIETLFITHGLLFFLIFFYLFAPKAES